jgi:hypothetical protein
MIDTQYLLFLLYYDLFLQGMSLGDLLRMSPIFKDMCKHLELILTPMSIESFQDFDSLCQFTSPGFPLTEKV